ncbi:MAG: hypothetical protein VX127_11785 [Myxococcota bacterium]|mgnify:CR=1 FL=1|jgi:hypothetical protein|nr:hypothetical protein [Myxococcota bacterium]
MIAAVGFWFASLGCVHSHHMTAMSDIDAPAPLSEGRLVQSEANQIVTLGVARDTQFAADAYADLAAQCPSGTVTGVQTRYSSALGFFQWEHTVKMWGYCFD